MGACASRLSATASFASLYELDDKQLLAERQFSAVYGGRHLATGSPVAVKRILKQRPPPSSFSALLSSSSPPPPSQGTRSSASSGSRGSPGAGGTGWESELAAIRRCALPHHHPNVVRFERVFESRREVLVVMEFVGGGQLFDALISDGAYSEWDARRFAKDALEALKFLHGRGVVHRDITPENLVFTTRNSKTANIKVVNFATAKLLNDRATPTQMLEQLTWPYCAPEILATTRDQIVQNILLGSFSMSDERSSSWSSVSREAKELLTLLLEVDPAKRPSAAEALGHAWFASPHTPREPLSVSVSDGLGQYQRQMRKKFRTSVLAAMAVEAFRRSLKRHQEAALVVDAVDDAAVGSQDRLQDGCPQAQAAQAEPVAEEIRSEHRILDEPSISEASEADFRSVTAGGVPSLEHQGPSASSSDGGAARSAGKQRSVLSLVFQQQLPNSEANAAGAVAVGGDGCGRGAPTDLVKMDDIRIDGPQVAR